MSAFLAGFLGLGFYIYSQDSILDKRMISSKAAYAFRIEADQKYKKFDQMIQPRIVAVKVNMNIFPADGHFEAQGEYLLVNRSAKTIDTLILSLGFEEDTSYRFTQATTLMSADSLVKVEMLKLHQGLEPGDSLKLCFEIHPVRHALFQTNANVLANGTFIGDEVFPRLGYRAGGMPSHPADSTAREHSYMSRDSDGIAFEAIVSTSPDQMAIAPGYLQKEWQENGRRYFHYKVEDKIKFNFGFQSAHYAVEREIWNDISLEIYYHRKHAYNLSRMRRGLKASLGYNARHFGPYQHRQASLIEFPVSLGTHATTLANTMPCSEVRFIAEVDTASGTIDIPFYVAAHEMAHQWWGNQVAPANAWGAKMITESMAEYIALRVLEQEYGKLELRRFLQNNLDRYLSGRAAEREQENPLMYCKPEQQYLAYGKGALVLYALSSYLGEESLNRALQAYLGKVRFQGPPYSTTLEMVDYLRQATPDSLQYLIQDMFETVTLYDNSVSSAAMVPLDHGRYRVDIEFMISKYRQEAQGHRSYTALAGATLAYQEAGMKEPILSLPLADYIEVAILGEEEINGRKEAVELYAKKHKIMQIKNNISIIVDKKPVEVSIDPDLKLIDAHPRDNRRKL